MDTSLAERLRLLRESRGLSQEQLGEALNKGGSTIANYELGRREPDLETLRQIAKYFGVTVAYLIGEDPYPHRYSTDEVQNIMRARGAAISFFRAEGATEEDIKVFLDVLEQRKKLYALKTAADQAVAESQPQHKYNVDKTDGDDDRP